jgi:DNA (cytosine-5)-methyltransferase 1
LIADLVAQGRGPRAVVLENVVGALTSHGGRDLQAIATAISGAGYRFGALVIDAIHFVPQSRPRLFIVAMQESESIPAKLVAATPDSLWQPARVQRAFASLPSRQKHKWIWWRLPSPPPRESSLADLLEREPRDVRWRSDAQTERLLAQMTETNVAKLRAAEAKGGVAVGCVYRRMRRENGLNVQRAEARFDGVAGCLRTPAGGSSRQFLLIAQNGRVRSRLLSARETARLMGAPDSYRLPANYNAAYHLMGDAVVPPAVSCLERHVLRPLLEG